VETFSQRRGLEPLKKKIQIDSMDKRLKNRLWNVLSKCYWSRVRSSTGISGGVYLSGNTEIRVLCERLWDDYYARPLHSLSNDYDRVMEEITGDYFGSRWNKVYDFIEFVAKNYPSENINSNFVEGCNLVLEKEVSAYRFVGSKITPITSEVEIDTIQRALSSPLDTVNEHIKTALELFADRENPDYRNSIKESISAVESVCKVIAGNDSATLGQALIEIEQSGRIELHTDLKEALKKLYHYTSDDSGIRHALTDESTVDSEDARFMLVSCSAFVNYLIEKARKAGIDLG